jgi:hypothetical protein
MKQYTVLFHVLLLAWVALCLILVNFAYAEEVVPVWTTTAKIGPNFDGSIVASGDASKASFITYRKDGASNELLPGILSETNMDFSASTWAGASYAIYGVARGTGPNIGSWGVHDIVGVHGTAYKDFNGWAAGGHFDCYDTAPGGTCVGVNIELPKTQAGTDTVGLNIQPHESARGLIGIQLQNPQTYKFGIVAANTPWVVGLVDYVPFGFVFDPKTQRLKFCRNVGLPEQVCRGYVDMNFEAPDSQLNKKD